MVDPKEMEVPQDIKDTLERYVNHGIPTGDFLGAILKNDLSGAVARADRQNIFLIPAITMYVEWSIPARSRGSPEAVRTWLDGYWRVYGVGRQVLNDILAQKESEGPEKENVYPPVPGS